VRKIKAALAAMLVIVLLGIAAAKDKPSYQTGKLIDVSVQDVTRGIAVIGGIAAPIPGRLYVFQIRFEDLDYFAEYKAGKNSYKPDWVVNDPIEFRVSNENRMFLKRPDGKELEVMIVKKVRQD
jgi:hypothetical protein